MRHSTGTWLLALCFAGAAHATPDKSNDPPPSMELLEFLGEWQTSKGELIDPLQLQDVETPDESPKVKKGDQHG
ncbi:MAG: hypothetical protein HY273_01660 [Gammaproteobacteria bacterium]|nr:hypothetical protein [Gammaproteobacteria bacterium]